VMARYWYRCKCMWMYLRLHHRKCDKQSVHGSVIMCGVEWGDYVLEGY
jgi:hypothetical protein